MIKKIIWETKSLKLAGLIGGGSKNEFYSGGILYNYKVYSLLAAKYSITINQSKVKSNGQSLVSYFLNNTFSNIIDSDIIISDPFSFVFNLMPSYKKQIVIVHHIDIKNEKDSFLQKYFNKILIYKIKKVKKIVVVSQFWYDFLIDCGVDKDKIKIIYNSYDLSKYNISDNEKNIFRSKYNLSDKKPIIYIGVADPIKGVDDVYNELKNEDYQIVMTGSSNKAHKNTNAQFLSLDKYEFRVLLSVSNVVIVMSKLNEGWNRVAHEAILSKTVVIGSGEHGMHELLNETGQYICSEIKNLKDLVNLALIDKMPLLDGYNYIKKYDNKYFKLNWIKVIES